MEHVAPVHMAVTIRGKAVFSQNFYMVRTVSRAQKIVISLHYAMHSSLGESFEAASALAETTSVKAMEQRQFGSRRTLPSELVLLHAAKMIDHQFRTERQANSLLLHVTVVELVSGNVGDGDRWRECLRKSGEKRTKMYGRYLLILRWLVSQEIL
jgi:hypothetical protein